ncbi:hypothetical protein QJU23_07630 [Pasteurella atlantica]|uniref:Uncharacterized protein n=2 Tax=Pasteurellaceae TaxID=712 RepID=A0ACC6HN46_9PAST|nr:hypothetical protein [Pasteurella atlantica]MDP8052291.1 hypothetical protein [Pasteurella atlantica]MDP8101772.1 hypothetical protein [Pasteurella atlantica]MDP8105799.1 hypothetical protein [Pasteurella atlantica]MDP8149136.1 hypothetical protein [Pasteurella atlantica]
MRLTLNEVQCIIALKNKYFGFESKIFLFGSRLDDQVKGGDIDLYLIPEENSENPFSLKSKFLIALQNEIGEQKIDLIIASDRNRVIEREAMKGMELDIGQIKLRKYLNECDKHLLRINEAYEDIKDIIPLSVSKYTTLNKNEVRNIDQYLYRFSKLQDTLGQKIFKSILAIYEPNIEPLPFLDILNRLEKLHFLEDKNEWLALREKRNRIAHQYDDEPYEMVQALNDILYYKNILESIYLYIRNKLIDNSEKN